MNVVLIGLGGIGMQYDLYTPGHAQTHARAIQRRGPEIWFAVDPDDGARRTFELHFNGSTVAEVDSLPKDIRWDLIVIASPTARHSLDLEWACEQEPGLILLEKPVASSEAELTMMENRVSLSSSPVMVNLIRNYEPTTQAWLKRIPTTGELSVQVNYAKGLIHNGIHFLTLLMHAFGPIDRIEVLTDSTERPAVKAVLGRVIAYFLPNDVGSALNGMSIRQGASEWTWIQGGRYLLEVGSDIPRLLVNDSFSQYQSYVLDYAEKVMAGAPDNSFRLAVEAQRQFHRILKQEYSS